MVGVHRGTIAHELGIDRRVARQGMLQFFNQQCRATFTHYETISVRVEGATSASRIVVAGGESAHHVEASDGQRMQPTLAATGQHSIGRAPGYHLKCLTNGIGPGRTSGDHRHIRATKPIFDSYLGSRRIY